MSVFMVARDTMLGFLFCVFVWLSVGTCITDFLEIPVPVMTEHVLSGMLSSPQSLAYVSSQDGLIFMTTFIALLDLPLPPTDINGIDVFPMF